MTHSNANRCACALLLGNIFSNDNSLSSQKCFSERDNERLIFDFFRFINSRVPGSLLALIFPSALHLFCYCYFTSLSFIIKYMKPSFVLMKDNFLLKESEITRLMMLPKQLPF